jgi:hypothetical protein
VAVVMVVAAKAREIAERRTMLSPSQEDGESSSRGSSQRKGQGISSNDGLIASRLTEI